jgi:hypothetical protein
MADMQDRARDPDTTPIPTRTLTPCSARSPCIALREAGYDLPDGLPVHLVTERPIVSYAARFLWSVSNPRRWMNEIEVD